jgi:hypothetical protein
MGRLTHLQFEEGAGWHLSDRRQPLQEACDAKPESAERTIPSLPSWNQAAKRGHGRVIAATKAPQTRGIRHREVTRAWTRVDPPQEEP